jgi:signal transduction histidine kinase
MRHRITRGARELVQLLAGAGTGLAATGLCVLALLSLPTSLAAGLGIVLFAGVMWLTRGLAERQRRRAVLGKPVPSPYRPLPQRLLPRVRALLRDPATWRDLAWLPCQAFAGLVGLALGPGLWLAAVQCLVVPVLAAVLPAATFHPAVLEITGRSGLWPWLLVPVGALLAVAAYRLPRHLIAGQARLVGWLLAATRADTAARLGARVQHLTATRAAAVEASAVELRRVERDLHDGAQARLVALAMNLGMAEDVIDTDPSTARLLLAQAKQGAGAALSELRDLVRGIHPPVLADRGLTGAVQALALASGVPVELDVRLDRRLAAPVESAAYFAIAESLTNAIRHGAARTVRVSVADRGSVLHITVCDDGRGGADPAAGTGLRGIQRRLSAFDGTVCIASPPGGPTVLDMELPCGC